VTIKVAWEMLAGAIFSEKVALIAMLTGTLGAGVTVSGAVKITLGRVVSRVLPLVKCQTKVGNKAPVARLVIPVTVAV